MELVLQNKDSLAFVENLDGGWTKDRQHARIFSGDLEALFFCLSRHLKNMQIVVKFMDSRSDFAVPVTDARSD